ncbi:MAG TPA: hypothetical protein VFB45_15465 [Pseudolabrys sp.]|nr:hypothetical protein [Pseudolabrys sp.]
MVTRTYACLNRNCRNEFDSEANHPSCPRCKGLRVKWVPKGFAIMKKAPGYDATIRTLTDRAGLTNMNEPRHGERAAPHRYEGPRAAKFEERQIGSFRGKVGIASNGSPVASCEPNGMSQRVTANVAPNQTQKFTPSAAVPVRQGDRTVMAPLGGPKAQVVARHKGTS